MSRLRLRTTKYLATVRMRKTATTTKIMMYIFAGEKPEVDVSEDVDELAMSVLKLVRSVLL